jgi:hypothetical protein
MGAQLKQDAEIAVKELRLFVSLYRDVELIPDSRIARQVQGARRAIAAYEEAEMLLAARNRAG